MPTASLDRDKVRDYFHDQVLQALDYAAAQTFCTVSEIKPSGLGAMDIDLPVLFLNLDKHIEVLANRYGVTLVTELEQRPEHANSSP